MSRMRLLVTLLGSGVLACSGSTTGSNTGGGTPVTATVHDVQTGVVTPGHSIIFDDVVVMAISAAGDRVWVSDALTASARAGVEVYRGAGAGALAASVGDHIRVEGAIQEFGAGGGGSITQIASPTITIVSFATGVPVAVGGLSLAGLIQDATGEDYEGVLVTVTNVSASNTSPYTLTDGTSSFVAGHQIITPADPVGTCYASVTGIWDFDVTTDAWIIVPTIGGLVTGGTCA